MAYTTHGHHVYGTSKDNAPSYPVRCRGIGTCTQCTREIAKVVDMNMRRAARDKGNNDG